MTEAEQRLRLGELVAARREQLGLSVPKAADAAGIYRDTWRDLEAGHRVMRSYNRTAVEQVLRWEQGSVKAVLAGGEPTLAEADTPEPAGARQRDPIENLIINDPVLPDNYKKALLEDYHLGRATLEREVRSKIALFKKASGS